MKVNHRKITNNLVRVFGNLNFALSAAIFCSGLTLFIVSIETVIIYQEKSFLYLLAVQGAIICLLSLIYYDNSKIIIKNSMKKFEFTLRLYLSIAVLYILSKTLTKFIIFIN